MFASGYNFCLIDPMKRGQEGKLAAEAAEAMVDRTVSVDVPGGVIPGKYVGIVCTTKRLIAKSCLDGKYVPKTTNFSGMSVKKIGNSTPGQ